jgi:hypothetical protein
VAAAFDGGAVTSDAGGLLLGTTDRAIKLVDRFADCFTDHRRADLMRCQSLKNWSRERRVVAKAVVTQGDTNPRFVVTSLSRTEAQAQHLYEKIYCARG